MNAIASVSAPSASGPRERASGGRRGLDGRSSGILLHPTCLEGHYGCGDVGPSARAFADFLAAAGQRYWQMLPIGPTGFGNSPYSAESAFAIDPLLIDLENLEARGWIAGEDLSAAPAFPQGQVDYDAARRFRMGILRKAYGSFVAAAGSSSDLAGGLAAFVGANAGWIDDYALYAALKRARNGQPWTAWEPNLRTRDPETLRSAARELDHEVGFHKFLQFVADAQLGSLRQHLAARGIRLIGDVPLFVAHDSADVWQHRRLFRVDEGGALEVVAGVPPDYFSRTGQRWGNPVYRWSESAKEGYDFWVRRFAVSLARFDVLRLDHFIGYVRAWEIPASSPTAEHGAWAAGPGAALFDRVREVIGGLPFIAEDLGVVTPEVEALRDALGLPGLRVLQFAFGEDPAAPTFFPHRYPRNCVAVTGTHDNDTVVGWFNDRGGGERSGDQVIKERALALRYLGSDGKEVNWDMIRMVLLSVADTAILPLQDALGLGSEARMNIPSVVGGNWEWRIPEGALTRDLAGRIAGLTRLYGRSDEDPRTVTPPASLAILDAPRPAKGEVR